MDEKQPDVFERELPPSVWNGYDRRRKESWHVGKEVPISLILVIFLQTGGGIWWASQMTAKFDFALATLAEFKVERYTKEDARRDREILQIMIEASIKRDAILEARVTALERKVNKD